MKKKCLWLLLLSMFFICCGCAPPEQELPKIKESSKNLLVDSGNKFTIKLFQTLKKKEGNLFFSGYSISSALTMVYAGAKGETAKKIAGVLSLPENKDELHAANAWLMINLNNRGLRGDLKLNVANRLWGQKGHTFEEGFLRTLRENYLAGLGIVDFQNSSDVAREEINDWVKKQTQNMITDLIPRNALSENTRLVLTSALYFKGIWEEDFDKSKTQPRPFAVNGKNNEMVSMMSSSVTKKTRWMEDSDVSIAELPYRNAGISMVIVLPKKKDGWKDIESTLTSQKLDQWFDKLKRMSLLVSLPKFKMKQSIELKTLLKEMGLKVATTAGLADFSGMDGKKNLFIESANHKASVSVDEEGTVAAAATSFGMGVTSSLSGRSFRVDRPFFFFIRDNETKSILFMGRVLDPR